MDRPTHSTVDRRRRKFVANPQGRRVATFRGTTDQYPKETFVYHGGGVGGARGPSFTGGVLLRDRNATLTDVTKWATEVAGAVRAERNYYLADFRGNVAAIVSSAGNLVEQYRYGPSGVPYGIPLGDLNADGVVDGAKGAADYVLINNIIIAGGYEDRADVNLDGKVDAADKTIVASNDGHATGRGKLSVGAVGNRFGPAQYECFGIGLLTLCSVKANVFDSGLAMWNNASAQSYHTKSTTTILKDSDDVWTTPPTVSPMIPTTSCCGACQITTEGPRSASIPPRCPFLTAEDWKKGLENASCPAIAPPIFRDVACVPEPGSSHCTCFGVVTQTSNLVQCTISASHTDRDNSLHICTVTTLVVQTTNTLEGNCVAYGGTN